MAKFSTKILYCTITWYLILQPHQVKTIQFPLSQDYLKLDPINYVKDCSFIDNVQNIRGYALRAYYCPTYKKTTLDRKIALIQNKREEFKTQLVASEQEILTAIKEKYKVNDIIWNQCLTTIKNVKNHYNKGLLQKHPYIKHDPNIPTDTLKTLITLLQQNNINPQSVHIKMVSDHQPNQCIKTLACVQSFITATEIGKKNQQLFINPTYTPPVIEISSLSNTFSSTEKISFYAHEIEHLLQQHSLTILILEEYLDYYYNIKPEQFKQTPEYHQLSRIHEAQAEIGAATKNPYVADCLTTMRKKYFYPNYLYQEHFYQLSTINMLWKVHAWLQFLRTIKFTLPTTHKK